MSNFEQDLIAAGFKRLDKGLVQENAPKITWGEKFKTWSHHRKEEYLMKVASTMNHAAAKIQHERDQLLALLEKKEAMIEQGKKALIQNQEMLTSEINRMNEERQARNAAYSELNTKCRKLESELEQYKRAERKKSTSAG